jgi:hypothetical protein
MNPNNPSYDVALRFTQVPEALLADLRLVFPVRPITPASNPQDIYYQAGVQAVLTLLADVLRRQKETTDVFRHEHS